MKKGFTLLEIIIVVVLISILATLALVRYQKMVETTRASEAKNILSRIMKAEASYYLEWDAYVNTVDLSPAEAFAKLGFSELPACSWTEDCCQPNHYFWYDALDNTGPQFRVGAIRCNSTKSGKPPGYAWQYYLNLFENGTFASNNPDVL